MNDVGVTVRGTMHTIVWREDTTFAIADTGCGIKITPADEWSWTFGASNAPPPHVKGCAWCYEMTPLP